MKTVEINGTLRTDLGKKATKALRREEKVPCVIYGGEENVHFFASEKEFRQIIYTPNVYIIKLNIDGKVYDTVLKDSQFHPVSDEVLHLDFLQISEEKPVEIQVPVKIEGYAPGVKVGGKLSVLNRKLRVKALPKFLPDTLLVNIGGLDLGQSIQVHELSYDNIELTNAANMVVVSVQLTRAARAAKEAEAKED